MKKAIQLVETRSGCAMCEREPRYDVIFRGVKIGQLYFNLRGYVGVLPCPSYDREYNNLHIGEVSITKYKQEVAKLNKEWARCDAQREQKI
jgi:hypothetical protein